MIKLQIDEINEELEKFNGGIARFRPYTEGFIKNTRDSLKGFNSDYADKMKQLLENMSDTGAPKLLEKAEKLYKATKSAVESFEQTDRTIKNKIDKEK